MKKNSVMYNLLGVILCGLATPAAADFCSQTCNDCCEWSMLDGKATIGADWLYWKVQQDGIIPGAVEVADLTSTPTVTRREVKRANSKWTNGFRVSLGYELPCDCWDVKVCYTYLPSRASLVKFDDTVDAGRFTNLLGDSFASFASKWKLTFNNIDLDIGRVVSFGECLKMRPHVGIRATWFDQKFRSIGSNPEVGASAVLPSTFVANRLKQTFEGYGVEAGLWADYKLGCGVSLIGHFGGSILYSKFSVRNHASEGVIAVDETIEVSAIRLGRSTFHTATPSLDYFIGVQYADVMCDVLFKVYAGWEQHVLFNTNRFFAFDAGNLSGQGLTLGLDVGF